MRHLKAFRMPELKKAAVMIAILVIAIFLALGFLPKGKVQAVAPESENSAAEDIYKLILDRTLPLVGVSMNEGMDTELSGPLGYNLFKYITKIDIKNPRTYLDSEIPLLGMVDINTLSGNVDGIPGKAGEVNEGNPPVDDGRENFDDKPVVNPNVDPNNPAVLIYHTHATESFIPTPKYNYKIMGDHRSLEREFNVCRIGLEVKNYLEAYYGLGVVQETTLHDNPTYKDSYKKSRPTAENLLKKYPNAAFLIDIHRDAFADDNAAREKMVISIRGEQAAKVLFVIGKRNPHWQENYYLAQKLNQKIEELYPGLSKGIRVKENSIYHQDISNKGLLIEIGSECNTMEESMVSAKMVARSIGQLLKPQ